MAVEPGASKVTPGATTTFDITIQTGDDKPAGLHCVCIELLNPAGNVMKHYSRNLLTRKASVSFSFAPALNDSAGTWQLRATHIATGRTVTVPFDVEEMSTP